MTVLSDEFYYQPITIDTINTQVFSLLTAKEGDSNGRGLLVTLTEHGVTKNTTGISLNFKWEHTTTGGQGLDNFTAVDLTKGTYKITYPTEMNYPGIVKAYIQIIDTDKLVGTRNIKISVEPNVGDDTAIGSLDSFTALTAALLAVQNINQFVSVPTTATTAGVVGDYSADANYFYICRATDTWVRVGIATW